jgi:hypothetical protein
MQLMFLNPQIHYDIQSIVSHALEHHTADSGKERAVVWWKKFLHSFLSLPQKWLEPTGATYELPPGTTVKTAFGVGTLKLVRHDDTCLVSLPFGEAYLQPEAVDPQNVVAPMGTPGTAAADTAAAAAAAAAADASTAEPSDAATDMDTGNAAAGDYYELLV